MNGTYQFAPSIVAVVNLKGGTGKTTIAVNLACQLQQIAFDLPEMWESLWGTIPSQPVVSLIDADPLGTARHWAVKGDLNVAVEGIHVASRSVLESLLHRIVTTKKPGCLVIDTPGQNESLVAYCAKLARLVLIPVSASKADMPSTVATLELLEALGKADGRHQPKCLLVPNGIDLRTVIGRQVESSLMQLGVPVGPAIANRVGFVNAYAAGLWIGDYEPFGPAHAQIEMLARTIENDTVKCLDRQPVSRELASLCRPSAPFSSWSELRRGISSLLSQSWQEPREKRPLGNRRVPIHTQTQDGSLEWTTPEGKSVTQSIRLISVPGVGPRLELTQPLPMGQTIRVRLSAEDVVHKAIVESCRETSAGIVAAIRFVHRERRRQDRHPVGGSGTLEWTGARGHREESVVVRNATEDGIQLQVHSPIPSSSSVRLTRGTVQFIGHVCYCQPFGHNYLVGIHV